MLCAHSCHNFHLPAQRPCTGVLPLVGHVVRHTSLQLPQQYSFQATSGSLGPGLHGPNGSETELQRNRSPQDSACAHAGSACSRTLQRPAPTPNAQYCHGVYNFRFFRVFILVVAAILCLVGFPVPSGAVLFTIPCCRHSPPRSVDLTIPLYSFDHRYHSQCLL